MKSIQRSLPVLCLLPVLLAAACHGKGRAGSTFELPGQTIKAPGLNWNHLNMVFEADSKRGSLSEQVAVAITTGKDETDAELNTMMPRWSFLSQAQVDSLVQYLQTGFKPGRSFVLTSVTRNSLP